MMCSHTCTCTYWIACKQREPPQFYLLFTSHDFQLLDIKKVYTPWYTAFTVWTVWTVYFRNDLYKCCISSNIISCIDNVTIMVVFVYNLPHLHSLDILHTHWTFIVLHTFTAFTHHIHSFTWHIHSFTYTGYIQVTDFQNGFS